MEKIVEILHKNRKSEEIKIFCGKMDATKCHKLEMVLIIEFSTLVTAGKNWMWHF
jgi:hypothetical protein